MASDELLDDSTADSGAASLLEVIPQPVWVCNSDGVLQFNNSEADDWMNRSALDGGEHVQEILAGIAASSATFRIRGRIESVLEAATDKDFDGESFSVPLGESSPEAAGKLLEVTVRQLPNSKAEEPALVFTGQPTFSDEPGLLEDAEFAERVARLELASLGAHAGLWFWELDSDTFFYSERFTEILGYNGHGTDESRETWFKRVHEEDRPKLDAAISRYLKDSSAESPGDPFEVELRVRHADSGFRWVLFRGVGSVDDDGYVRQMGGSVTDITDRKRAEQRQQYDAFHDKLTDLPNRALFLDRLAQLLEVQREYATRRFGLLYMDLDRFKKINDSLGPSAGDDLLCQVTDRIRDCTRESDTVARVGGDEFGLLLVNVDGPSVAKRIAGEIQEALDEPFQLAGREIYISASIGVLVSDPDYNHAEEMLRDVDIAMYHAKSNDADIAMFDAEMHASVLGESHLESSLRHAVDSEQIVSHYQPIVDLNDGTIVGLEALMRWQHPDAGWVPPGEFFPIAKETGLLVAMGQSLLKEVCRQMHIWRKNGVVEPDVRLSVNFSASELTERGFVSNVERVLEQTGLPGEALQAEITEHALISQPDRAGEVLDNLKALGVGVAIDDFGTGYSSLNYLRQFDSDAIKIDRDFVEHLPEREDDREIVTTILRLADSLNKRVVCEGIETASQNEMLRELGVDYGQGFYWGRPAPAGDVEEALVGRSRLKPSDKIAEGA